MTNSLDNLRGKFIVIEGTDGAGTTVQTSKLLCWLIERGVFALHTHEPTRELPVGKLIRNYLTKELRAPCWETMALLFAADRIDHCREVIEPALRSGITVISDRYYLSSFIYQSLSRDRDRPNHDRSRGVSEATARLEWIQSINSAAITPDHTLVLTVSPPTAKARRGTRGGQEELFEQAELQERICMAYNDPHLWFRSSEVYTLIDGEDSEEDVAMNILKALGQ